MIGEHADWLYRKMIDAGQGLDERDLYGASPLHWAAYLGLAPFCEVFASPLSFFSNSRDAEHAPEAAKPCTV